MTFTSSLKAAQESSTRREALEERRTLAETPTNEEDLRAGALKAAQESSARREELENNW